MFNSFSAALSALKAHSAAVDTVGHNLANLNTTGFKASSVAFRDLVSASLAAGRGETGMGVTRPMTVRSFAQGAVQATSGPMDAAIQGSGFFVLRDSSGTQFFSRDGTFQVDAAGVVRTLTGEKVQGWTATGAAVSTAGPIGDIKVPVGSSPANATSMFSVVANLNSAAAVGSPGGTFSTAVEVIDTQGASHVVTVTFTKTAPNNWDYDVTIPGEEVSGGTAGTPSSVATGSIEFNEDGTLLTPDAASGAIDITLTGLTNGAGDLAMQWNLYDGVTPTLTQFAQTSSVSKTFQDGVPAGEVVNIGMADGGLIVARLSNGQQKVVAQVALALFSNPESLMPSGNNNFQTSIESSPAVFGIPGTGGRGKIKGGALESSTVDIAREFTNLIVFQRGYQANSRVITTADELSQETLNLKR